MHTMSATISFSYFSVSSLLRHIIVHAQQVDLILINESRKIIDPSTNKKPQKNYTSTMNQSQGFSFVDSRTTLRHPSRCCWGLGPWGTWEILNIRTRQQFEKRGSIQNSERSYASSNKYNKAMSTLQVFGCQYGCCSYSMPVAFYGMYIWSVS